MRIDIDILSFVVMEHQVNVFHKEHGLHGIIIKKPFTYFRDVRYEDGEKEQKEIKMIRQYIDPNYGGEFGLELSLGMEIVKYDEHGNAIKKNIETKM